MSDICGINISPLLLFGSRAAVSPSSRLGKSMIRTQVTTSFDYADPIVAAVGIEKGSFTEVDRRLRGTAELSVRAPYTTSRGHFIAAAYKYHDTRVREKDRTVVRTKLRGWNRGGELVHLCSP